MAAKKYFKPCAGDIWGFLKRVYEHIFPCVPSVVYVKKTCRWQVPQTRPVWCPGTSSESAELVLKHDLTWGSCYLMLPKVASALGSEYTQIWWCFVEVCRTQSDRARYEKAPQIPSVAS